MKVFKNKGSAIIYVTHKLEEVFLICDSVSVLRDGKLIGTDKIENLNKESIIEMMVGRKLKLSSYGDLSATDELALEVKELFKKDKADNINFSLFKGEILGFYGLVGSGRTEVAKLVVGLDKKDRGNIFIKGKKVIINTLFDGLYKYKLGYISENRKEEGLLLNSDVKTNICITLWQKIVSRLLKFISDKKELEISKEWVKILDIKISSLNQKALSLSGGNQQKVSLSKWLAADCDILIIDEPTVGVDVGAKEAIHEIIFNLAKKDNKSVILISSDMPEIIKLSSRILVFKDKKIVGEIGNINSASDYDLLSRKIGSYLH
ncbi:MAG: ATP-binding cassette domain-containing protein [Actinobacteria bacterium]|nr:ATP-binding cassette domain-containing protein [Actinomycetota bacterium]